MTLKISDTSKKTPEGISNKLTWSLINCNIGLQKIYLTVEKSGFLFKRPIKISPVKKKSCNHIKEDQIW